MSSWLVVGPGWLLLGKEAEALRALREEEALTEFAEAAADGWGTVERLLDAYRPPVDRLPAWLPQGISRKQALARWEELLAGGTVQADAAQAVLDEWGISGSTEPMLTSFRRWRKKSFVKGLRST